MNSLQPERSQRSSSSAISVSPASIIIWTSSRSSERSRAQRGWTKIQLLPSVERRTLMPSDDPDGRRELGLRLDKDSPDGFPRRHDGHDEKTLDGITGSAGLTGLVSKRERDCRLFFHPVYPATPVILSCFYLCGVVVVQISLPNS